MKNFFTGNKIKVLLHLLAWTILLGFPLYFIKRWEVGKDFIWLYYINTIISGIIFYVNYLLLVPKFFFGKKNYKYYLSVIVLIACFYFVSDCSNELVFKYVSEGIKQNRLNENTKNESHTLPPGWRVMMAGLHSAKCIFLIMCLPHCFLSFSLWD